MERLRGVVARYSGLLAAGLTFAVGVYLFVKAGEIPRLVQKGQLGPDVWPRLILGGLIALSLLKGALALAGPGRATGPGGEAEGVSRDWRRLVGGIFLALAYVYFTTVLGFPLANFLFLFSFMYLGGDRRLLLLVLLPTLGTIALLYLFVKVVYLPLPRGVWIFDDLTIALFRVLRIF